MRSIVQDLHNHTVFSYDGTDTPESIIENAANHGVGIIGISDHQFSIENLTEYKDRILSCKERYKNSIKVLLGLEIGTRPAPDNLDPRDVSDFDYVLFESLDDPRAMNFNDFLTWRKDFSCPCGLAHCDIWKLADMYGLKSHEILRILRRDKIFWEINTSGNYAYYYDFLTNPEKRDEIQRSRVTLTVGSDTHWVAEYRYKQLRKMNELVTVLHNPLLADELK